MIDSQTKGQTIDSQIRVKSWLAVAGWMVGQMMVSMVELFSVDEWMRYAAGQRDQQIPGNGKLAGKLAGKWMLSSELGWKDGQPDRQTSRQLDTEMNRR